MNLCTPRAQVEGAVEAAELHHIGATSIALFVHQRNVFGLNEPSRQVVGMTGFQASSRRGDVAICAHNLGLLGLHHGAHAAGTDGVKAVEQQHILTNTLTTVPMAL